MPDIETIIEKAKSAGLSFSFSERTSVFKVLFQSRIKEIGMAVDEISGIHRFPAFKLNLLEY